MEKLIQTLYHGSNTQLINTLFSETSKKFLHKLYSQLQTIKVPDYSIDNINATKYGDHFNSIPNNIKSYIKKTKMFCTHIKCKIDSKHVEIYFMHPDKHFSDMIDLILRWLTYAYSIAPDGCSRQLRVFIYLTPFKKEIPNFEVIDRSHANNAFTFACIENNEINIFREEEWFKVFIHETIHALGIDFSQFNHGRISNPALKKIYNINIDFHLHEAYCETLATFFNVCLRHQHQSFKVFYKNLHKKLFLEAIFSLYQSAKILNRYGIDYKQLIRGRSPQMYNENTPLFSYFIIKSTLFYHLDAFIISRSSKGIVFKEQHLKSFLELIERMSKKIPYSKDISKIQTMISNFKHPQAKSLRFSLYG